MSDNSELKQFFLRRKENFPNTAILHETLELVISSFNIIKEEFPELDTSEAFEALEKHSTYFVNEQTANRDTD